MVVPLIVAEIDGVLNLAEIVTALEKALHVRFHDLSLHLQP